MIKITCRRKMGRVWTKLCKFDA